MIQNRLGREYFEWLYSTVCGKRFARENSFRKLLIYLHNTEFKYTIPMDENRAEDGIGLRYRFALRFGYEDIYEEYLYGPCTVLEMMIALAIACEEHIMDDPAKGDRTGQWFWGMINNLGLGGMIDDRFDEDYVDEVVHLLVHREYGPDGEGGLFTIKDADQDLREVEIWHQLCWYLNSIT